MALLFLEGFDAYGTNGYIADSVMESAGYMLYQNFNPLPNIMVSSDTRTGVGYSVVTNTWGYWAGGFRRAFNMSTSLVAGFSVKVNTSAFTSICSFLYNDLIGDEWTQVTINYNGVNGVSVVTGDNAHVYSSSPNVLFQGVWQYIEVKYNPGAGSLQLKVDGVVVINVISQPVSSGGVANYINKIGFGGSGPWMIYVDDIYVCDETGAAFNDYMGDCIVHSILPNADGGVNQFTQTGGTSGHFSAINENPEDGDASYLSSNTTGQMELFTLPALPFDVVDVLAVGVNVFARKSAPGVALYKAVISVGGVEADGASVPTSIDYVMTQTIFTVPPGSGAWSRIAAQSASIGLKIA